MHHIIDSTERYADTDRLYLRLLTPDDVTSEYLSWFRDDLVTEYLDAKNLTRQEVVDYIAKGHAAGQHAMYGIFLAEQDRHIGNVKIGPMNWKHMTSGLVTVIGDRHSWGKGIAREAIAIATRLAFDVYGFRKLSDGVASGNIGSLKAYCSAGWVHEATMKGHHVISGSARDRLVISCFNPAFFSDAMQYDK